MFLSDFSIFSKISASGRSEIKFKDENDPEVDRLYNSSPIITESSTTYEIDDHYKIDPEISAHRRDGSKIPNSITREMPPKVDSKNIDSILLTDKIVDDDGKVKPVVSGLTVMLKQFEEKQLLSGSEKGKVSLIIYLPNYSPMKIAAKEECDFREVIGIILNTHKERAIQPPLDYNNPKNYELRIHEGDGEPDRDFPALDLSKKLKNFNLEDYCLCEVEDGGGNDSFSNGTSLSPQALSNDVFAPSQFESLNLFSAGSFKDASGKSTDRRTSDADDWANVEDNYVTILFPNGNQLEVQVPPDGDGEEEREATFTDLLPLICEKYRLRLYTDEYIFNISQKDQHRLQLMSPAVDMRHTVKSVGCKTFEIQKKAYADTPRISSKASVPTANHTRRHDKHNSTSEAIVFNEATANAYQEWNVVKKNKFGRKQERVFGVDGKKVYNSKRGQYRGGVATGVQRAERDIGTIVKNEVLAGDAKTFRITWMDDKDIYNIEYSCETERECAEIVAKIKYILSRLRNKR